MSSCAEAPDDQPDGVPADSAEQPEGGKEIASLPYIEAEPVRDKEQTSLKHRGEPVDEIDGGTRRTAVAAACCAATRGNALRGRACAVSGSDNWPSAWPVP
jgi:hypothetical protein